MEKISMLYWWLEFFKIITLLIDWFYNVFVSYLLHCFFHLIGSGLIYFQEAGSFNGFINIKILSQESENSKDTPLESSWL